MEEQFLGRKPLVTDARRLKTSMPDPAAEAPLFYPQTTRITSTSWDGDSFGTTAKTKIDLSAVFSGVPASIEAVLLFVTVRDDDSANGDYGLILSPNDTDGHGFSCKATHAPSDSLHTYCCTIPCNSDGDIYYQIAAHGAGTFDVWIEVWGWWI